MSHALDNPFAIRPPQRRRPLAASLKGLLGIAALLAAIVVLQSQTRQWLLHRWVSGFADLPVGEQIERLLQINSLGDVATETLARRIAAADERVAATAFELVREHQSSWSARDDDSLARAHARMLEGLASIIDDLPPKRAAWVSQLLNQTILECVEQQGAAMKQTYATANALAARLADRNAASPQLVASVKSQGISTQNLATENASMRGQSTSDHAPPSLVPLPVRLQNLDDDMQLPADESRRFAAESPPAVPRGAAEPVMVAAAGPEQAVHRVATDAELVPATRPEPIRMLSSNSLQTFDTKSVISLLASKQAATRDSAVEELVRRGLSNEEIRVANQLASPEVEVRFGLLESIIRRTDLDPRPWLLWLTEDPSREVRIRAVSALATMNDTAVTLALRKRLVAETDPAVAAHIRRVIEQR